MSTYNAVLFAAIENVKKEYCQGNVQIRTEADLQCLLFSECLKLMSQKGFEKPFKLHAEKDVFKRGQKIDLVLGDDEVLVEIKVEPNHPGVNKPVVFSAIQEACGSGGSVEEDLKKIKNYAEKGKHAHFIILDEDGRHAKKFLEIGIHSMSKAKGLTFCTYIINLRRLRARLFVLMEERGGLLPRCKLP